MTVQTGLCLIWWETQFVRFLTRWLIYVFLYVSGKFISYLMGVTMTVSILTLTAVGLDRHYVILYPVSSRQHRYVGNKMVLIHNVSSLVPTSFVTNFSPLCLVRAPLWPQVRQAKFFLRVCQVVFSRGPPVFAHLQIGPSHRSLNNLERDVKLN